MGTEENTDLIFQRKYNFNKKFGLPIHFASKKSEVQVYENTGLGPA